MGEVTGMTVEATTDDVVISRRRRGEQLEDAIRQAALDELVEVGFGSMSMENIAARAQTGKASVYRRWPTKHDLVLDVVDQHLCIPPGANPFDIPDDVTTEAALRMVAHNIVQTINSPVGDAIRVLKCEAAVDPELGRMIDQRFQEPRSDALIRLLERGVARGEVRPEAVCPLVADVVPALLAYRMVLQRRSVSEADLNEIIDDVFLPLISTGRAPGRSTS